MNKTTEQLYDRNNATTAQVITFASMKGGVGKTITALGTAHELSSTEYSPRVIFVDADVRYGLTGSIVGKTTPNILDVAASTTINKNSIKNNIIIDDNDGLSYLLPPDKPDRVTDEFYANSGAVYSDVINVLKTMFDIIIIDTGNDNYSKTNADIFAASDAIVLVTNLDRMSVIGTMRWIISVSSDDEKLATRDVDISKIGVLVNRFSNNVRISRHELEHVLMIAVDKVNKQLSTSYRAPRIISAIPEIPDNSLVRLINMQRFDQSVDIPEFSKPIKELLIKTTDTAIAPYATHDISSKRLARNN